MDGGAWWAAVHGSLIVGHNWMTSLSLFTFMHWWRKLQSTPVFFLENPRIGGTWWAAVHGVAQSQTQLQLLSSSNSKILITHCFRVLFIRECILKAPGELLKLKTPGPSNYNKYPEMCHSLYVLTNSPVILICSRTEEHCPRSWFSSLSCISHLELQKGETKEESKK